MMRKRVIFFCVQKIDEVLRPRLLMLLVCWDDTEVTNLLFLAVCELVHTKFAGYFLLLPFVVGNLDDYVTAVK